MPNQNIQSIKPKDKKGIPVLQDIVNSPKIPKPKKDKPSLNIDTKLNVIQDNPETTNNKPKTSVSDIKPISIVKSQPSNEKIDIIF